MKDLCIVHIGMPKTGSSALQQALFKHLKDKNVAYANLPTVSHGEAIINMFSEFNPNHHFNAGRLKEEIDAKAQENRRLLVQGFNQHPGSIEIISGEAIYHMHNKALIKFRSFLQRFFKKILIVCYVRSPKSFMESAFQQLVKYHDLGTFDFTRIYHPYKKLQKFDAIFGQENVLLWEFEPEKFPNKDITLDFCQKLNIEYQSENVLRSNDSISLEAIKLLYVFNKYGLGIDAGIQTYNLKDLLVKSVSTIGHEKLRFDSKLIAEVLDYFDEDYRWIKNRMKNDLLDKEVECENAINTEQDLFKFSDEVVFELENKVDPEGVYSDFRACRLDYVVKLMNILVQQLAKDNHIINSPKNYQISSKEEQKDYDLISSFNLDWSKYYEDNQLPKIELDPILHYIRFWQDKDDLIVSNVFSTKYYLSSYQDVQEMKQNPLLHYLCHGKDEGRLGKEVS